MWQMLVVMEGCVGDRSAGAHLQRKRQIPCPAAVPVTVQDGFIANVLHSAPDTSALMDIRNRAAASLTDAQMPTRDVEAYRFTNLSPLVGKSVVAPQAVDESADVVTANAARCMIGAASGSQIVVIDGTIISSASQLSNIPAGVFVGRLDDAPEAAKQALGSMSVSRGGLFSQLNTAAAADALVFHIPPNTTCTSPIHVLYMSSSSQADGSVAHSSPRLLVLAGEGASCEIIEEFVGFASDESRYFVNSVAEVALSRGSRVIHRYAQGDEAGAFCIRSTFVSQEAGSEYDLVEARVGGALTRCAKYSLRMLLLMIVVVVSALGQASK
jgi:Fe-S cluster assembly protein SufD